MIKVHEANIKELIKAHEEIKRWETVANYSM